MADDAHDAQDAQPFPTAKPAEQEPTTPPGDCNGTDVKNSRKREREVSLEPATPQPVVQELENGRSEEKDRRTPAKKNRTSDTTLESTKEEVEEEMPTTGSPPHETKIRQISQGVEDITWKNMKKDEPADKSPTLMDEDAPAPAEDAQDVAIPDAHGEHADAPPTAPAPTGQALVGVEGQQPPALPPPAASVGPNPPIVDDGEGTGAAAGAEQPPDSRVAGAPQPSGAVATSAVVDSLQAPAASDQIPFGDVPRLPSSRRDSDSDGEKKLKRKLGDRTASAALDGVSMSRNGTPVPGAVATKRPRDDPEVDPNTREKKRPTPPPDEEKAKAIELLKAQEKEKEGAKKDAPAPSVLGGFAMYAAPNSPFATVSGPRLFGAKSPSPFGASPFASGSTSPSPLAAAVAAQEAQAASSASSSSSTGATPAKRTGFEAFASATSPWASAAKRPKSPPPATANALGRSRSPSRHGTPARATNAFSAYAFGGAQGFAAPSPRRSVFGEGAAASALTNPLALANQNALDSGRDSDESEKEGGEKESTGAKAVSFGERLRAGKDWEEGEEGEEEKKLQLTEQEVHTGEEDEETVYQVRGKLFALSDQNMWKERGTGMLRINVRRDDGSGARLIMRKEAVHNVLLNATLFKGMRCVLAQDPRYIRFGVFEAGVATHYNLRVSSAKIAMELLEEINAHIPSE
ncbi:uncharacterized protein BXZ73DRAFT_44063 [Epithele typhae]|uniref:uncharacterized protein n=1 Tax=Epithele typhae TaxID=378194 RepID=UPI0020074E73|nr:uncharacterized protein BXZ73DRAFT_44063 [Epithele typhae]KAH9939073.1 hypothetical protein BXZ73DRAFT_44063 [Epithele typhae]